MGKTATEAQQTSARRSRVNLCLGFQAEKATADAKTMITNG